MIILDISKVEETVDAGLVYVQNDSVHVLEMTIQDNGAAVDLTGKTAKIRFCTRGGFVSDEPCTIVSAAAGTLSYKMLGAQLVRGEVLGIVSLYVGDERQSTSKFRLLCVDDLSSDESVKDSVQYSELQKAITAAEAATGAAGEAAEYAQAQGDYAKEKGDAVSLEWEPHVADKVIHITSEERAGWNNKVDKAEGKGLSANDYTDEEKAKLAGVAPEATKTTIGSSDGKTTINTQNVGGSAKTVFLYPAAVMDEKLAEKVDKVTGKGLSANDYTTAEKEKLAGIEAEAQKNVVTSVAGKTGAVVLDKSDVGLPSVKDLEQAGKAEFDAHNGDNVRHITAAERSGWNGKVSQTELSDGLALKADKADFDAHDGDNVRHITPQERARWDASAIVGDASGEKIVLDDIAPQGAIRELEIYGKSEQQTSTQGKNLLDTTGIGVGSNFSNYVNDVTFEHQADGGVRVKGTYMNEYAPYSTRFELIDKLTVGKTYTKSMTGGVTGINFSVKAIRQDDTAISTPTFTLDDTIKSVKAYVLIDRIDAPIDTTVYLQVEEGSVATTYEPFVPNKPSPEYPSEIKSAENFTALFLRGKNLLDTTGMDRTYNGITYTRQADGGVKISGTSTAYSQSKLVNITDRLTRGKTYVKSWTVSATDYSFQCVLTYNDGTVKYLSTFTFDDTVSKVEVYLQVHKADVTVDTTVYLQVEEGSVATAYEPYGGTVVNIPYELRGVPNTTGGWLARDYIEVKDGAVKLVRECASIVLDETITWYAIDPSIYGISDTTMLYNNAVDYGETMMKWASRPLCDKCRSYAWSTAPADDVYIWVSTGGNGRFRLCLKDDYLGVATTATLAERKDAFMAWVAENPLKLCYQLATPTVEDITETETGQALLAFTLTAPDAALSNTAGSGMAVRYEVDGTIAYKKLASAIVALGGTI